MTDIRQTLCAPRVAGKKDKPDMVDLLNTTMTSVVEQIKVILTNLKVCRSACEQSKSYCPTNIYLTDCGKYLVMATKD